MKPNQELLDNLFEAWGTNHLGVRLFKDSFIQICSLIERADDVERLVTISKCRDCGWAREFDDGDYCRHRDLETRITIDIDNPPPKGCPLRCIDMAWR